MTKRLVIDVPALLDAYCVRKLSLLECATLFGCVRGPLARTLRENGISLRGERAAQQIRSDRLTPEQKRKNAETANASVRGKKAPEEHRKAHALSRQATGSVSQLEKSFLREFEKRGYSPIPQFAVERYNVDLALTDHRIAVEIDPGTWHTTHAQKDSMKNARLVANGWRVLRFWGPLVAPKYVHLQRLVEDAIGWFEKTCLDPTSFGKDGVVWCYPKKLLPDSDHHEFAVDVSHVHRYHRPRLAAQTS